MLTKKLVQLESAMLKDKIHVICGAWISTSRDVSSIEWFLSKESDKTLNLVLQTLKKSITKNLDNLVDLLLEIDDLSGYYSDTIKLALYAVIVSHLNSKETIGTISEKELQLRNEINKKSLSIRFRVSHKEEE